MNIRFITVIMFVIFLVSCSNRGGGSTPSKSEVPDVADKPIVKRTLEELVNYEVGGHFGCDVRRIHGKDETGAAEFWVGRSTILPGGGAEYAYEDNPLEKVYYILEGEITVTDSEGVKYNVKKGETVSFKPFAGRSFVNESNKPTTMLVIINYPNEYERDNSADGISGKPIVKRTLEELVNYEVGGHFGCDVRRIHGKDETGAAEFWVGRSTILPGGGAEYAYEDNPLEKVYYILEGEITVTDSEGVKYNVKKGETVSFKPFAGRSFVNESNKPTTMLVIINYPS